MMPFFFKRGSPCRIFETSVFFVNIIKNYSQSISLKLVPLCGDEIFKWKIKKIELS